MNSYPCFSGLYNWPPPKKKKKQATLAHCERMILHNHRQLCKFQLQWQVV